MGLEEEFRRRGPWITRFVLDGVESGGTYDPRLDPRLIACIERFGEEAEDGGPRGLRGNVLEVGCFEGGHTVELAARTLFPGEVRAIDARPANLERAEWIVARHGLGDRVLFQEADVESWEPSEHFDLVFCVGVLYHLADPIEVLRRMRTWGTNLFLWTHVGPPGHRQAEAGWEDRLSGLHPDSPWPTAYEVWDALVDGYTWAAMETLPIVDRSSIMPDAAVMGFGGEARP